MDITAALPELEDDFFITAQMTSTTLQKQWRKIYLIRKDKKEANWKYSHQGIR
jgi:hypothetical protein